MQKILEQDEPKQLFYPSEKRKKKSGKGKTAIAKIEHAKFLVSKALQGRVFEV